MMKTRKILIGLLLVVLTVGGTTAIFAFGRRGPGAGHFGLMGPGMLNSDLIMSRLKEHVQLTEEQEAKLLPVLEEQLEKWRETFKNARGGFREEFQDMRATFEERWQETEQHLAAILTAEQMQTIQQLKKTRMGRFSRAGFVGNAEKFHQFLADLNLSDEQKQELATIFRSRYENRQNGIQLLLDSHKAVTDQILTDGFDEQMVRERFRQQVPKLEDLVVEHAKMLADMKAVLTPKQIETFQTKRAEFFKQIEQWRSEHPRGLGWF